MGFQGKLALRAVMIVAAVFERLLPTEADELIHPFNDLAFNFTIAPINSDCVVE